MDIKPIRTVADHAAALKEIERLWDKAQPGTREGEKFEVLSTLVDAYEREHIEIRTPDPRALEAPLSLDIRQLHQAGEPTRLRAHAVREVQEAHPPRGGRLLSQEPRLLLREVLPLADDGLNGCWGRGVWEHHRAARRSSSPASRS